MSKKSCTFAADFRKGKKMKMIMKMIIKTKKMKKNWFTMGLIAFAAMIGLAGCDHTEQQVNAFVGTYEYVTTGEATFYVAGTKVATLPLNQSGEFEIVRSGAANRVAIVSLGDSVFGTVKGKELTLETTTTTMNYNGIEAQLTFLNDKAQLVADSLIQWKTDVNASATYSGYAATGTGNVNLVAVKKK